jgi:hypothetical protein
VIGLWLVVLVGSAVAVVCSGVAAGLRNRRPAVALQFVPGDARALSRMADTSLLVENGQLRDPSEARRYARAALARDATLPASWRILGLIAPDGSALSIKLLETAQRLSRRDALTQFALIELAVGRGDILGALDHYDILLRISSAYDAVLFPVLLGASTEPPIRQVLGQKLLRAPMWRRRFLAYMVNTATPYPVQADLFSAIAKGGRSFPDSDIVASQATNSALGGNYAIARHLYGLVAPSEVTQRLRNGGFDKDGGVPPFDWQYDTDGALTVAVASFGPGQRLEIISERGDGARAARQLLFLTPGRYRLAGQVGAIEGESVGRPYMTMTCADAGTPLLTVDTQPKAGRAAGIVIVPNGCAVQWLELGMRQNSIGTRAAAWIDGVAIDRVGG